MDLYDHMLDFCKTHDEIKLSEMTDFDWDIAYIDRDYYQSGEKIKEKYGIEGEFELLQTDFSSRVAFCKDGKLVYDLILNHCYIEMDSSIDVIKPDSVFIITKEPIDDSKEMKACLSVKQIPKQHSNLQRSYG